MRKDLILRYLRTSIERLDLVRRHLQGEFEEKETSTDQNPRKISDCDTEEFQNLSENYLETVQTLVNLINSALKVQREKK